MLTPLLVEAVLKTIIKVMMKSLVVKTFSCFSMEIRQNDMQPALLCFGPTLPVFIIFQDPKTIRIQEQSPAAVNNLKSG
jgi:hypothetical protein